MTLPLYGEVLIGIAGTYIGIVLILILWTRWKVNGSLINRVIQTNKDLAGYYVIVTGSNAGIGFEIAKYLVLHGAYVVLACRSEERGRAAEFLINTDAETSSIYGEGRAEFMQVDLSSLDSTREFIANYKATGYPLHILMNNAGLSGDDCTRDFVWKVNYLSHFLITHELTPLMIRSSVENKEMDCRIVNTSSLFHANGKIDFDTLKSDEMMAQKAKKNRFYGVTKLAQIMVWSLLFPAFVGFLVSDICPLFPCIQHTSYLQREIFDKHEIPICTSSVHPGAVRTNIFGPMLQSLCVKVLFYVFYPVWYFGFRSSEQGSRTNIYCAVAPIGDHKNSWGGVFVPGEYHVNMKRSTTNDAGGQSTNVDDMRKLYEYSLETLGLRDQNYQTMGGSSVAGTVITFTS